MDLIKMLVEKLDLTKDEILKLHRMVPYTDEVDSKVRNLKWLMKRIEGTLFYMNVCDGQKIDNDKEALVIADVVCSACGQNLPKEQYTHIITLKCDKE